MHTFLTSFCRWTGTGSWLFRCSFLYFCIICFGYSEFDCIVFVFWYRVPLQWWVMITIVLLLLAVQEICDFKIFTILSNLILIWNPILRQAFDFDFKSLCLIVNHFSRDFPRHCSLVVFLLHFYGETFVKIDWEWRCRWKQQRSRCYEEMWWQP